MRSGKGNQEFDEYEDDDFNSKRDGSSANTSNTNAKDKNSDKANAIRSKHSVTEQRRRSKINERFQILRDIIPHSEQKRDTASFLLEVIDYVKYLQEKVQKYEETYPGWNSEPAKLMPWRNSHWRTQSFSGQPHATKNGSGPVTLFHGKFEENNPNVLGNTHNTLELETGQEVLNKAIDHAMPAPVPTDVMVAHPLQRPVGSDFQSVADPLTENSVSLSEGLSIEGGTINISSVYSQGLLNTLTDALQSAGVDLSQASISVQIELGNRANRGHVAGTSAASDQDGPLPGNSMAADIRDAVDGEEGSVQSQQKRQKT